MDNNGVTAMISVIMILIGFTNGLFWGNILKYIELSNLNEVVQLEKSIRKDYEELTEELELANKQLQDKLEDTENKLYSIKRLVSLPPLPPPSTPLKRSTPQFSDTDEIETDYGSTDEDSMD